MSDANIDNEERFHLALKAMGDGNAERAIDLLKVVIKAEPENGRALYLLGALHADLGMYERAVTELQQSVRLEPGIPAAHFQLGLLLAMSGRADDAETAWSALDPVREDDPYGVLKRGLSHLLHDRFDESIADLERGMELNTENPALNEDMLHVLTNVRVEFDKASGDNTGDSAQLPQSGSAKVHNIFMSAYEDDDNTE